MGVCLQKKKKKNHCVQVGLSWKTSVLQGALSLKQKQHTGGWFMPALQAVKPLILSGLVTTYRLHLLHGGARSKGWKKSADFEQMNKLTFMQ